MDISYPFDEPPSRITRDAFFNFLDDLGINRETGNNEDYLYAKDEISQLGIEDARIITKLENWSAEYIGAKE